MDKELDVKLETVKMRDYRAALNRDVNKIARFDMLKQDISDYVIKNHWNLMIIKVTFHQLRRVLFCAYLISIMVW